MHRMLVVANQTLGGDALLDLLRQRVDEGECSIHVLVPAGAPVDQWAWHVETEDMELAEQRLQAAIERFSALGAPVDGEVGDARPTDAILDVLRRHDFDEIILSTLPPRVSKWLRLDLVHRVQRAVDIPVTHVTAAPDHTPAGSERGE